MTVCKYYLQGSCKFGDQCRYEHPDANGHNSAAMTDPFSAPSAGNQQKGKGSDRNARKPARPPRDVPQWPLTCVGAHPLSSGNTITGDMSQEELRAEAYSIAPHGFSPEIVHREETVVAEFQQRNNGAPALSTQAAPSGDPFAAAHSAQQPVNSGDPFGTATAPHLQQQPQSQQNSVFSQLQLQPPQQPPIFPQPPAQNPMSFSSPPGNGFVVDQAQQGGPHSFPPIVNTSPATAISPQGALDHGLSNAEAFSQAQFSFQKVPETPTPLGFR